MRDPAIDWIRVDVVSPRHLKSTIRVGANRTDSIAERAADVDVDVVVADDEAGIVAAPGSDDVGDRRRRRGGAGEGGEDREESPHTLSLPVRRRLSRWGRSIRARRLLRDVMLELGVERRAPLTLGRAHLRFGPGVQIAGRDYLFRSLDLDKHH